MLGSSIVRKLQKLNYSNLLTPTRRELFLLSQNDTQTYLSHHRPEIVINCAGLVGGIDFNRNNMARSLEENLLIQLNVLSACRDSYVSRLINFGSSCIYPKLAPQPLKEESLLTSELEPTNEGYALAKIVGMKLGEYYKNEGQLDVVNLMPCNLFGINDNFSSKTSHVFAALIKKFVDAKNDSNDTKREVTVWGDGTPKREFLDTDEVANITEQLLWKKELPTTINVGSGIPISIAELACEIRDIVDPSIKINYDSTMPNGTPIKYMDISRLKNLGITPKFDLGKSITKMVSVYKSTMKNNQ